MAIQVRRGTAAKFDASRLLPGEWAVELDTKRTYMCYAPGDVRRMATYEEMEENVAQIADSIISKSSGLKILFNGLIGGEASVSFAVPESCFFSYGRELILMVNGYCPQEVRGMYDMCIAGMCFGTASDFGAVNGPAYQGEFTRYAYRPETCDNSISNPNMQIEVLVKKVTDSRYAVCTVTNRSYCFYITSISAMIPA